MAIINQNAVLKHVPNINLKNAIRTVSNTVKLDLQIVLTAEQEAQFIEAQTSKKQLNFEHILIAARGTNGKTIDLENVQLIKALSKTAALFKGEVVYINGFLQTKTAKELPELHTTKVVDAAPPKSETLEVETPETEQSEAVEPDAKKAKTAKK